MYARGWRRARMQMPERYPAWRLMSFLGGVVAVFLAIASPLDALGELLLHLHMTQHMLLMMVAPPLLWLGQPLIPLLRSLPPRSAKRGLGPLLTSRPLRRAGCALTSPMVCWIALGVTIVVWHLPRFYDLGLESEGWHESRHACL